ncbi:MAG: membrane bound O-acyl transferase family-domain-containing protein [Planctomycetaceae bacterium]|nr:membrane bound O-acyl transferase family-domain-containing protein [Planctomycetaceae bacterium]
MYEPAASLSRMTTQPAWAVMWLVAIAVFFGCKVLTWQTAMTRLPVGRSAGYLCAWPGLDPRPFLDCVQERRSCPVPSEWFLAAGKTLLGIVLLWVGVRHVPEEWPLSAAWVGIVGLGFLLHLGTFHLLALAWQTAGYDVRPLMDAPHRSTSLAEFWSRRWNLAFRDLSHRFVLQPLRPRLGLSGAVFTVFLFSGVVHDAVISVPAGGGYGLPTLYFVLQAAGLMVQRTRLARKWRLNRGVGGWIATTTFVLGPLPLLFHEPFLRRIVLPFLAAIGAC